MIVVVCCACRTLALVKPDGYQAMGRILDIILANGFVIAKAKLLRLSPDDAARFYEEHASRPFYKCVFPFPFLLLFLLKPLWRQHASTGCAHHVSGNGPDHVAPFYFATS